MFTINKMTANSVIDYAAEELRKYLRMMMPEGGSVEIRYDPQASAGFRLGLMQDFGLDVSDVKDVTLDDILYFDCDEKGGVIAGDNPRSVLLSVYEYLRHQGCRWILPGVDGELVPLKDIRPAKLRHVPSMRYRGWVSEGTEFQQSMIEAVELAPKLGMNVFMIEFKFPKSYYERYYNHDNNPYREPEPVSMNTLMQWKRQLETEITKRGLQYHDMGHGFTYEPLGIAGEDGWDTSYDEKVTPQQRELMALIDGERKIQYYPINTNLCMSNPKARKKMVDYAVNYAKVHGNVDYLHIWLADAKNNHCECEECVKKRPTDFYVMMLNELDEALSAEGLDTKIVFIVYMDTSWAPLEERIKNQERFLLMLAPITRRYDISLEGDKITAKTNPYVRNDLQLPQSLEEFYAYFNEWREGWKGSNISFEYHFWRAMWNDITGIRLAKLLHEDVRAYSANGIDGMLEDGSQRCFFPNGFELYTYARAMFNKETSFEEILEDYYTTAYGKDWKQVYDYMMELDEAFDYQFMVRRKSANPKVSLLYCPEHVKNLERVKEICTRAREVVKSLRQKEYRVRTVSMRLLEYHLEYAELLAEAYIPKALGKDDEAFARYQTLVDTMARHEVTIEKYYDHCLMANALKVVFQNMVSHNEYMDVE